MAQSSKKAKTAVQSVMENTLPIEVYLSASMIYGSLKVAFHNDYEEHRPKDDELQQRALSQATEIYQRYLALPKSKGK